MSTEEERAVNNDKITDIIVKTCLGNKAAERYLYDISFVSRVFDDLVDGDVVIDTANICRAFHILVVGMITNPFFMLNSHVLVGVHNIAFNGWMDATNWEKTGDELKMKYAHVIRDSINEIVETVAFLVGGYGHMRSISMETRELFIKKGGK